MDGFFAASRTCGTLTNGDFYFLTAPFDTSFGLLRVRKSYKKSHRLMAFSLPLQDLNLRPSD